MNVFGPPLYYLNRKSYSAVACVIQGPPARSEQDIQEEEELQLALALSQSEAEAKDKEVCVQMMYPIIFIKIVLIFMFEVVL